ncbi:MAG TPA: GtrA family protein [Candidatus Limiplasma sp.]|nr:GtrA family protein [Candidatus Limiplasma sp.]
MSALQKLLGHRLIRFALVGGTATLLDYGLYMALGWALPLPAAKGISTTLACVYSFFLQRRWTFRAAPASLPMAVRYLLTQAVNISVNVLVNQLAYGVLHQRTLAFALATAAATTVNYLLQKAFVFSPPKTDGSDGP